MQNLIPANINLYNCHQKQLLHLMETYFSRHLSNRLEEIYFLSTGNNMLLFGAFLLLLETMIEIRGNQFQQKIFSCQWKLFSIFLPEATVFPYSGNVFFNGCFVSGSIVLYSLIYCRCYNLVLQKNFIANLYLLLIYSGKGFCGQYKPQAFFPSSGNVYSILMNPSFQLFEKDFLFSENRLLCLRVLSCQPKPSLARVETIS